MKHDFYSHRHLNFLIVDDHKEFSTKLKSHLSQIGFTGKKSYASNVKEAKSILNNLKFHRDKPDFIFSDWLMPDETGIDFLQWVRKSLEYKSIPFVLVTTLNQLDAICEAIDKGADEYLTKPWDKSDLSKVINQVLQKRNM